MQLTSPFNVNQAISHSDKANNITPPSKPIVWNWEPQNPAAILAWSFHCWLVTPLPFLGSTPIMQYQSIYQFNHGEALNSCHLRPAWK